MNVSAQSAPASERTRAHTRARMHTRELIVTDEVGFFTQQLITTHFHHYQHMEDILFFKKLPSLKKWQVTTNLSNRSVHLCGR